MKAQLIDVVKVRKNGSMTLPKRAREHLGITNKDTILYVMAQKNEIILTVGYTSEKKKK